MIIGFIIDLAVGLFILILGMQIWKKQKISLLHDYHYKNVKEKDIQAYTRLIGISLILLGIGICITGLLILFESSRWWIPILAGFVIFFLLMNKAQKKYNGSWF